MKYLSILLMLVSSASAVADGIKGVLIGTTARAGVDCRALKNGVIIHQITLTGDGDHGLYGEFLKDIWINYATEFFDNETPAHLAITTKDANGEWVTDSVKHPCKNSECKFELTVHGITFQCSKLGPWTNFKHW